MNFPLIDLGIAVIVIWAVLLGIKRGFIKSLLSLASFILSVLLAFFITNGIIVVAGGWIGLQSGAFAIFDAIAKSILMLVLFCLFEVVFNYIEIHIAGNRLTGGSEAVGKLLGFSVGLVKAITIVIFILTALLFLFPGENPITEQIQISVVGQFLFERNPLPKIITLLVG